MFDPDEVPEMAARTPITDLRGPADAGPKMPAAMVARGADLLRTGLPVYVRL